jgi:vitamin B12/bleomycin/antimicrobial peptide transport system ATP-binding/permease protein
LNVAAAPDEAALPEIGALRIDAGSATANFWRIGSGFFSGRKARAARLLVGALAVLGILQVCVQLLVNFWSGAVFDVIEKRDIDGVLAQVVALAALAIAYFVFSGYHMHVKMRLQVNWRVWITDRLIADWLVGDRPARLAAMGAGYDNPDQRIAEDVRLATESAVDFADGIFSAVLTLGCFVGVLWSLSGWLRVEIGPWATLSIPGYLVFGAIAYAAAGTWLTHVFGRPLVQLNQVRLGREADYRIALTRARDDVVTDDSLASQRREITARFRNLAALWDILIRRTRRLTYVTEGYAVIGAGFPVLLAAPHYFSHAITLGGLMQSTAAFVTVQMTLSWFVNNYARFADWSASVERISAFRRALDGLADETTGEKAKTAS